MAIATDVNFVMQGTTNALAVYSAASGATVGGPYPLLLYAHGFRSPSRRVASPINRDFTSIENMLRHVASWDCVCVAPDLSWLPGMRSICAPWCWCTT